MSKDFDEFWEELVRKHRRKNGFIPTPEELEAEAGTDSDEPLSEDEIDFIVAAVGRGTKPEIDIAPDISWLHDVDTSSVEDGVFQLNRNRGQSEKDVEERLSELRKKALEEDGDDENDLETT
jgi:hypothetical protein